jgi:hypothetical protein
MQHLNFSYQKDTLKEQEIDRIINEMIELCRDDLVKYSISDYKAKTMIQGFVKAVNFSICNNYTHKKDNAAWAISIEWVKQCVSNFCGKKFNGRFENILMQKFLVRDDSYNWGTNSHCKTTIGLHPLLEEALDLENYIAYQGLNWKEQLLTGGIKGISWSKKANSNPINIYGLTSVESLSINGGNILEVKRNENDATDNEIFGVLQFVEPKQCESALKRLDTLDRHTDKLKTDTKRMGRKIFISRMREWIQEALLNDGYYIDFYRKTSCGRFFGIGMNLQVMKSAITKTLFLKKSVELDQSSSHLTILRDRCADFEIFSEELNNFLSNKDEILTKISVESKMRKRTIKTLLLSTIYGKVGSRHESRHQILKTLCSEIRKLLSNLKILLGDDLFSSLYREETKRTAQIVNISGGFNNLLAWKHDGAIMLKMDNVDYSQLKLNFAFKVNH